MKKLICSLGLILSFSFSYSQYTITQNLGNSATLVQVPANGGFRGGLINRVFFDTTSANLSQLDFYDGSQVKTLSPNALWWRDSSYRVWRQVLPAGGGSGGSYGWLIGGNTWANDVDDLTFGGLTNNRILFKTNNTTRFILDSTGINRSSGAANKYLTYDTITKTLYYGDGGSSGWSLTGNASTTPGTNFVGTTDAQPLWINTNNVNRLIVPSGGIASSTDATDSVLVTKTDGVTLGKIAKTALHPTWQQTLDAGSTFDKSNSILLSGFDLEFQGNGSEAFNIIGVNSFGVADPNGTRIAVTQTETQLVSTTVATRSSTIDVHTDSIWFKPSLGNFIIDSLTSAVGTKALRYNPTSGLVTYADTTTTGAPSLTATYIGYGDGSNLLTGSADHVIDVSGGAGLAKVGINTSTPGFALDVVGDIQTSTKIFNGNGNLEVGADGDINYNSGNSNHIFNGNISIGTLIAPTVALDVFGNIKGVSNETTGTAFDFSSSAITSGSLATFTNTGTAAASNTKKVLSIVSSGANATASQTVTGQTISVTNTGTTNTNVGLNVTASGATNNYAALFTGRVGIGTAAPAYNLEVSGTAYISGAVVTASLTPFGGINGGVNNAYDIGVTNAFRTGYFGTSVQAPLLIGGTTTTSALTYKTTTGVGTTGADHIFQVGNNGATEAMRILNSGSVGIGTTSPTAAKLQVTGNGAASVSGGLWDGTWFTGGTATTTKPQLLIEPTGTTSTGWSTSGTGIGVNAASGFTGHLLNWQVNGTERGRFNNDGSLTMTAGNIAVNGGNIAASGDVTSGAYFGATAKSWLRSATNGYWTMYNNATTDFTALQFGGTTSSFPAQFRNGTGIDIKLADNSAYTGLTAGILTANANGAASTPPLPVTGTWYTGGSATTTKPQLLIEPTGTTSTGWSTSGTGIGVNAASGFTGNFLDAHVNGGTSVFKVDYTGTADMNGLVLRGAGTMGSGSYLYETTAGNYYLINDKLRMSNNMQLQWFPGAANSGSADVTLSRNAAGILQVGTTAANALGTIAAAKHQVATSVFWSSGTGSPEGVLTANIGSLYSRTDGGAGTSFYVKESGTGNTGWVSK